MDINKFSIFNLISNIIIKENFGPYMVKIQPISLCKFDNITPTNRLHSHNNYELCFIIDGEGEYIHGDNTFSLTKGDIFISNPKVYHEIRLKKNYDFSYSSTLYLIFFNIDIKCLNQSYETPIATYEEKMITKFLNNHHIVVNGYSHMLSYIDFLSGYVLKPSGESYGAYNMIKAMALEGLFALCIPSTNSSLKKQVFSDEFNKLLLYIESNIGSPITILDMANYVFTSERNIHYMFEKYMKKTPKDYINERKINLAKIYLKMNYKVSDVSTLVGINDLGQFSRLFKKHCRVSPKKFQDSQIL